MRLPLPWVAATNCRQADHYSLGVAGVVSMKEQHVLFLFSKFIYLNLMRIFSIKFK
jgi:hypothetical protein